MRSERFKQVIAICENSADEFQDKMNDALARVADPEIVFDSNKSFTAYITYKVKKDVPEDLLEMFELLNGESHYCEECPHYVASQDKRRKWGSCSLKKVKTRPEGRACEHFYIWRMKKLEQAKNEYDNIPYMIE